MRLLTLLYTFITLLLVGQPVHSRAQEVEDYERAPINYSAAQPHDPAAALNDRIGSGKVRFGGDTDGAVVQTLLNELDISTNSQLLVFSKTSLQRQRISPDHPRALYFNDTCYVGWVPGGLVEVVGIDPILGPIFYALNPSALRTNSSASSTHVLTRDADCLRCHGGTFVRGIPGLLARSVFPDAEGEPLLRYGSEVVDFRTAFTNRWGGWYVTGQHGAALHRGNVLAKEKNDQLLVDFHQGANVTNLSDFFFTKRYLDEGASDIVALLVFEQQITIQNILTKASLNCRRMLDYQKNLQRALKDPFTDEPAYDSVKSVFDSSARELVDALLFQGEAELPSGLKGSVEFQHAFATGATTRRSHDGLSLRDLDLTHGHIFQNRCSYLIYSESFRQLPVPLRNRVFDRLRTALRQDNPDHRYAYIGSDERKRIVTILSETDPDLATQFEPLRCAK